MSVRPIIKLCSNVPTALCSPITPVDSPDHTAVVSPDYSDSHHVTLMRLIAGPGTVRSGLVRLLKPSLGAPATAPLRFDRPGSVALRPRGLPRVPLALGALGRLRPLRIRPGASGI